MNDYYTRLHAGVEGLRSESDSDWNWSQRSESLQRSGPSDAVRAKIKEFTRQFGPPPADLEMYGTFDEEDYGSPPVSEGLEVDDADPVLSGDSPDERSP